MDTTDFLNRNNKTKIIDNFYTSWLRIPDNIGNLLGRQTKRVDRPTINFETEYTNYRGNRYIDNSQVRFNSVSVSLFDDESSITSQFLYSQIFRQMKRTANLPDKWGRLDDDYKFDLKVEVFSSSGTMTEGYVLKDCFIQNILHTPLDVSAETESEIEVVLEYDNIDLFIMDEFVTLK